MRFNDHEGAARAQCSATLIHVNKRMFIILGN